MQLTSKRKDLLYRAVERGRIAERIVTSLFADGQEHRAILFHERVAETVELYDRLVAELQVPVQLEHSKLPDKRRQRALALFASGGARPRLS